jgi:hypothetical protein
VNRFSVPIYQLVVASVVAGSTLAAQTPADRLQVQVLSPFSRVRFVAVRAVYVLDAKGEKQTLGQATAVQPVTFSHKCFQGDVIGVDYSSPLLRPVDGKPCTNTAVITFEPSMNAQAMAQFAPTLAEHANTAADDGTKALAYYTLSTLPATGEATSVFAQDATKAAARMLGASSTADLAKKVSALQSKNKLAVTGTLDFKTLYALSGTDLGVLILGPGRLGG